MTGFPLRRAILAGALASAAVVPIAQPMPPPITDASVQPTVSLTHL